MALVGSVCIDNLAKTWPIFEAIVHTVTLKFLLFVLILLPIMPCLDTPDIVTLSQKCSLYRERVFLVYTLNPCFWPVRPHPLPVSHLPHTLAQFCDDYTKFFSSGMHGRGERRGGGSVCVCIH